jgi:hypothetical protein
MTAPDPLRTAIAARRAEKMARLRPPPAVAEPDADAVTVNAGEGTGELPAPLTHRQLVYEQIRRVLGIGRNPL